MFEQTGENERVHIIYQRQIPAIAECIFQFNVYAEELGRGVGLMYSRTELRVHIIEFPVQLLHIPLVCGDELNERQHYSQLSHTSRGLR